MYELFKYEMTKKEKRIKFWNGLTNEILSIRTTLCVWFKCYPKFKDIKSIRNLKYDTVTDIPVQSFNPITLNEDGSARPDMDSAFTKECAIYGSRDITILTKLKTVIGKGWGHDDEEGHYVPGEPVKKRSISASVNTPAIYDPIGIYCATLVFDNRAKGSWDAWWFHRMATKKEKGKPGGYQEWDMMERFFGTNDPPNVLTTTAHRGLDSQHRNMYNKSYRIPKSMNRIRMNSKFTGNKMKLYINGMLVWVGKQWQTQAPMKMIINSGLQEGTLLYVHDELKEQDYKFMVSNIKHYK